MVMARIPSSIPLNGVRVLELGSHVSAPFCARLLADYGADVIKIEPPGAGDPARRMGPFAGDDPHPDKSIPFLYLNTNKRGITLDPATTAGAGLLSELLDAADVLVENYPPDARPASWLAPEELAEHYSHLIVTSITPFGQTGPYRDFAATDIVTTAISGLMYHSGDSDQAPLRNALNQSFYVAGINGAVATTAALFQRLFIGRGQRIDVATVECLASHLVQAVPYYSYMGAIKGRRPVRGSGFEELMPARDGYVIPSVQGSQPWSAVADLIGVPELQDERFASGSGRIEFGEEIHRLLLEGPVPVGPQGAAPGIGRATIGLRNGPGRRRPVRMSPPAGAGLLPPGRASRRRRGGLSGPGPATVRPRCFAHGARSASARSAAGPA